MDRLTFSILVLTLTLVAAAGQDCGCLNSGECLEKGPTNRYCHCSGGFLDVQCSQTGAELVEQPQAASISEEYSYYFVTFNSTSLYFVQFIVCPASFQAGTVFQIYIEMEGQDGSLQQHPKDKDMNYFQPENTHCMVFKIVLLAFQLKPNGDYTRLVLRVRTTPVPIPANQTPSLAPITPTANQLRLSTIKYELYQGMQDLQIGQFLAVSTLSVLCVFFFSFVICRKFIRHRIPRFHYQPAEAVHCISHFDTLMPSYHYGLDSALPEDEKECMICLLTVEETRVRTTPCGHLFHADCIDQWGRKKLICPTCRSPLLPREGELSEMS